MMRLRHILAAALTALVCLSASAAHATTWPAPFDRPASYGVGWFVENGWTVPVDEQPVQLVFVGQPPAELTIEEVDQAVRGAVDSWSSVPCSTARVVYAGRRATLDDLAPGEIPFIFITPEQSSCFLEGTIAFTKLGCVDEYPNRTVFLNDAAFDWSSEPQPFQPAYTDPDGNHRLIIDLESVLTHEFGHVLGLSHSLDSLATMYASYRGDGGQRSLAVDDKLGMCSLYPAANPSDECSSGRDCGPRESCERIEGLDMCRELRGEPGAPCALDRLVCTEVCALAAQPDEFGYCTVGCDEGGEVCPKDFVCTQGLLQEGESHCERLATPGEPSCNVSGSRGPSPTSPAGLIVMLAIAGLGAARTRRRSNRV